MTLIGNKELEYRLYHHYCVCPKIYLKKKLHVILAEEPKPLMYLRPVSGPETFIQEFLEEWKK